VGTLWYIEKERLSGQFTVPTWVNRVDVNPKNSTQFSVSGKNYFRIWEFDISTRNFEIHKESLNTFQELEKEHIIDHCWIPENNLIVAATAQNLIYICSMTEIVLKYNFEYIPAELLNNDDTTNGGEKDRDSISEVDNLPAEEKKQENHAISCLEPTSKGFVVGLKKIPAICLFELDKNNELQNLGSFRSREDNVQGISSISTSADDLYLAVSVLSSNRAIVVENNEQESNKKDSLLSKFIQSMIQMQEEESKRKLDLYIFNKAVVDAVKSVQKDPFEPIFEKGVHNGAIKTVALCPSKTLLVSLADDNTAKFWEYGNDYRELYSIFFHDHPECIAIHPLAIQIAIGFSEGYLYI